jgi:hypothetical protein
MRQQPVSADEAADGGAVADALSATIHSRRAICVCVDALNSAPTRIIPAAGKASGEMFLRRCANALAAELGEPIAESPGDHAGPTTCHSPYFIDEIYLPYDNDIAWRIHENYPVAKEY